MVNKRPFSLPITTPCYSASSGNSHIIIINQNLTHSLSEINFHSVFVNLELLEGVVSVGSIYCPLKGDLEEDVRCWLSSRNQSSKQLLLGDFNAHSPLWSYPREDARGVLLIDQIMVHSYVILNPPSCPPTFESGGKIGRPDLSLCTQDLYPSIEGWEVLDKLYGDHYPIVTTINFEIPKLPRRRYKTKNIPFRNFNKIISREIGQIFKK